MPAQLVLEKAYTNLVQSDRSDGCSMADDVEMLFLLSCRDDRL